MSLITWPVGIAFASGNTKEPLCEPVNLACGDSMVSGNTKEPLCGPDYLACGVSMEPGFTVAVSRTVTFTSIINNYCNYIVQAGTILQR